MFAKRKQTTSNEYNMEHYKLQQDIIFTVIYQYENDG